MSEKEQQPLRQVDMATGISADALRWRPDPETFGFATTEEIEPLDSIIGQRRALEAIRLGAEIASPGYNVFVQGLAGTRRLRTIRRILNRIEAGTTEEPKLWDLAYVNNFNDPDRPCVLRLEKGRVRPLRAEMRAAIDYLRERIPAMFDDEQFRKGRSKIVAGFQEREQQMVSTFEEKIKPEGFILGQRQTGPNVSQPEILPVVDGTPYGVEDLDGLIKEEKLTVDEAREINRKIDGFQDDLYELIKTGRRLSGEYRRTMHEYEQKHARMLVTATLDEITSEFGHPSVIAFINQVRNHILANLDLFRRNGPEEVVESEGGPPPAREKGDRSEAAAAYEEIDIDDPFHVYDINILLDNAQTEGRPIVLVRNPTYANLFGTITRTRDPEEGWISNFSSIRSGAILEADGGFLIVNALDALSQPGVWPMLKRILLHRKIQIQPLETELRMGLTSSTTIAMKPEEIRSNVKVILIGSPQLYRALYGADEDFSKIFKVNAQFDYAIERSEGVLTDYARFVAKIVEEENLRHFTAEGVAAITEYGVEEAESAGKISLLFSEVADTIREACYWAGKEDAEYADRRHVERAIAMRIDRNSMWKEKIMERIDDGMLMIDTDGDRVGQINGLAVYDLGQVSFGKPSRITATTSVGKSGIVNIDREANLSGSIYHKGTLILTGFFRNRFAQQHSLSFSASIVFEQSYGGVDGDSASSTEVYALLSSLSRIPIRQSLAVTGSVNQWGEIQPIGGVNEKIEGFYDVCCRRELTGSQGVLIPVQNVPELMLRTDVVEAVAEGKFHIYPVATIDEGIELLTGIEAGRADDEGVYPEGTVNRRVADRLAELTQRLRSEQPTAIANGVSTQEGLDGE